mgnify:CR=1 FL=1|jgi:hypothetical protein
MILTILTLFSFVWVVGRLDFVFLIVAFVVLALWLPSVLRNLRWMRERKECLDLIGRLTLQHTQRAITREFTS